MATSIPCIQGKMGSVEYYLATMKAAEAVSKIRIAKELPNWDAMSIEERMQRDINWKRVEDQIARYLAEDEDRFFGALLVAIHNSEGIEFEPLADMPGLPKLYQNAAKSFGLLHLQGGELFFALDGQHRLKGVDTAISGKTHDGDIIEDFQPDHSLANDDLSVIFVPYEPAKRSRKIFNKVNKYAKQTSKGDNIITSEDDAFAIIARWLVGSDGKTPVLKQEIVNWKSNTLSESQALFTTISVLYETARKLLEGGHDINAQLRPAADKLDAYYEEVKGFWATLIKDFKVYKQAVDGPRSDLAVLRKKNLAMKPVAQMAIVEAFTIANKHGMALDDFVRALNKIPWDIDNDLWRHVLTLPGPKVLSGKTAVSLAARLIAHLVGAKLPKEDHAKLLDDFRNVQDEAGKAKSLPKPVA